MNYNILLVSNDSYYKLLSVCLKSILSVCNMEKIGKIFVADLGLCNENKTKINSMHGKIEIVDTNINIGNSNEIFSEDWVDAVSQKTRVLQMLIETGHTPIVMLDSDTIVMEDFCDVINPDFDIQICKRTVPMLRKDGLLLEHIASYVSINNNEAIRFVSAWINRLHERIGLNMGAPYETPAMVETIQKNTEFKIGSLDEKIVSCDNNYFPGITKIIHAKSRTKSDRISITRFTNIRNLPYKKVISLFDGTEKISFTVLFALKRIFSWYYFKQKIKKIIKK